MLFYLFTANCKSSVDALSFIKNISKLVEVKNIHKSFDDNHVLKGISATFQTGKINCIIGKSGSGKTVLLKTIIGLEQPNEGEVLYDNRQFTGSKAKFKKKRSGL